MRVVVTGANGFVGRALCKLLRETGYFVVAVVRSDRDGVGIAADEVCACGNIDAGTDWTLILAGAEVVVHLAARAHVLREQTSDPLAEFRIVNTAASLQLARKAESAGVRRFIFISSIGVNGAQTADKGFTENDIPAPASAYAISKWEAEQGLAQISSSGGMDVVVVRPPLIYGPGAPGNFNIMMKWLDRGVPLPLAAVDNRRSFVGLDNLTDLIKVCVTHSKAGGQTFLVADGEDISTSDLLRRLGMALGKPARLFSVPPRMLDLAATAMGKRDISVRLLSSLKVDSGKARAMLEWVPPLSLDAGLHETARAYLGSSDHVSKS
ncbi:SDR family oxidoreductase [Herbaspirillum lusitanum]|uniref:SDR family oxidoreductase n=2 Tax=Herbaspirillum lusitanum TaxID=213312 RepID=A0ABW9A8Q6_9BURK